MFRILLFCLAFLFSEALASEVRANLISDVKPQLSKLIEIKDFSKVNVEFADYYKKETIPNLNSLYSKIRIIPISIREDKSIKEAVLIGDTARDSAWGIKNFIAVVVLLDLKWQIMQFKEIDGAIKCKSKKQCKFAYYRQILNPKTPNDYIGAVINYAQYGASSHSFVTQIIGWNPYEKEYYINSINSSVPLIPDPSWSN